MSGTTQPLMKCRRVFQSLVTLAVEELCEAADALIAPVRLGVARPTASFNLVSSCIDAIQVSWPLAGPAHSPPLPSVLLTAQGL